MFERIMVANLASAGLGFVLGILAVLIPALTFPLMVACAVAFGACFPLMVAMSVVSAVQTFRH